MILAGFLPVLLGSEDGHMLTLWLLLYPPRNFARSLCARADGLWQPQLTEVTGISRRLPGASDGRRMSHGSKLLIGGFCTWG